MSRVRSRLGALWSLVFIRGRWVVVAAAVACVALGVALVLRGGGTSKLHAANFGAIRPGMTRAQVEGLLGGPAGDFGPNVDGIVEPTDGAVTQVFFVPSASPAQPSTWQDDRNRFFVFFDDRGQVVAASKANAFRRHSKNSTWRRLRRMLAGEF